MAVGAPQLGEAVGPLLAEGRGQLGVSPLAVDDGIEPKDRALGGGVELGQAQPQPRVAVG